jgi:hypothetical protein
VIRSRTYACEHEAKDAAEDILEALQQEIKALRRWDVHSSGSEALAVSVEDGDWLDIEDVYRIAGIDPIEIDYPTDK